MYMFMKLAIVFRLLVALMFSGFITILALNSFFNRAVSFADFFVSIGSFSKNCLKKFGLDRF